VGVFLSSGLDSATLAALAREEGGQLRTVTLGFEEFKGTPNDETPLAEMLGRHLGAAHETIWVTRSDFTSHLDRLFEAMDQPTTDGVNTYFVSLAARLASLKVALSGLGAMNSLAAIRVSRKCRGRCAGWRRATSRQH